MTCPSCQILSIENAVVSRYGKPCSPLVSLSIKSQQVCVIKGNNGSGKTSLLLCIASLVPLMSGKISFHPQNLKSPLIRIASLKHEEIIPSLTLSLIQSMINFLPARNYAQPSLSVREELEFWHALGQKEYSTNCLAPLCSSVETALEACQIDTLSNTKNSHLSSGQLQRLAIARMTLKPSYLWLLDEPSNHLDKQGLKTLSAISEKYISNGGTIIRTEPIISQDIPHDILINLSAFPVPSMESLYS